MRNVAIVAPLEVHKRLDEKGLLGTYQLLLAHEVLKAPVEHSDFWRYRSDKQTIIMDNSLIELGHPLPIDTVAEAALLVGAKILVLPDVLGNRAKTYKLFAGALEQAKLMELDKHFDLLGVAQGQTTQETFICGRDMLQAGATILSVPRNLTKLVGTRTEAVRLLGKLKARMHLLGFSDNLWDDFYTLQYPGVMGIDSTVPIWYQKELPSRPPVVADFGRRPEDYSDWKELSILNIANVKMVREWTKTHV